MLITLAALRLQLPHAALAALYRVSRPTLTRAVHEIRPLPARRGFAVPDRPGVRLRTLADVFNYADTEGVHLRIDGTEVQVRRPRVGRPGRKVFVSGKKKQNTAKTTTVSDGQGRALWPGAGAPAVSTTRAQCAPRVPPSNSVSTRRSESRSKLKNQVPLGDQYAWREAHRRQSPQRICVEHALGEQKTWRPLQRNTGREHYTETHAATAGVVSDRAAPRPARRRASTELALVGQTVC